MSTIDNLLADLSFKLPDVSVKDIDVADLMTINLHSLPEQFQEHLMYQSFFGMLLVEIRHKKSLKENELQDLRNELDAQFRTTIEKQSEARIKSSIENTVRWKGLRDIVTQLERQEGAVASIVSDLNRKGIALSVLTARGRAELSAGITH